MTAQVGRFRCDSYPDWVKNWLIRWLVHTWEPWWAGALWESCLGSLTGSIVSSSPWRELKLKFGASQTALASWVWIHSLLSMVRVTFWWTQGWTKRDHFMHSKATYTYSQWSSCLVLSWHESQPWLHITTQPPVCMPCFMLISAVNFGSSSFDKHSRLFSYANGHQAIWCVLIASIASSQIVYVSM